MANEREPFVLDFPDGQRVEDILKKAEANYSKAEIDVKMATKATMSDVERETKNLQNQINEIVRAPESGGDVAAEVYQARVGADGTNYSTLKQRLDSEMNVTFHFRGELSDLGYTTIAEATDIGCYSSLTPTTETLTDKPEGVTGPFSLLVNQWLSHGVQAPVQVLITKDGEIYQRFIAPSGDIRVEWTSIAPIVRKHSESLTAISENLYENKNIAMGMTTGKFWDISRTNAELKSVDYWSASEVIPVTAGETYTVNAIQGNSHETRIWTLCDNNLEIISRATDYFDESPHTEQFIIPTGATKLIISSKNSVTFTPSLLRKQSRIDALSDRLNTFTETSSIVIPITLEIGGIALDGQSKGNDKRARTPFYLPTNLLIGTIHFPIGTEHRFGYYTNGTDVSVNSWSDWSSATEDTINYPEKDTYSCFRILMKYSDNRTITSDLIPQIWFEYEQEVPNKVNSVSGYFISANTPAIGKNDVFELSPIIPVQSGVAYKATKFRNTILFDDDLRPTRMLSTVDITDNTIPVLTGEKYICFCWKNTDCPEMFFAPASEFIEGAVIDGLVPIPLLGKKLSLLGDSISSYAGTIPAGNDVYYTGNNSGVSDPTQMWWSVLCRKTGMVPCVINGWSGSAVTQLTDSAHINKVPMSDVSRCQALHTDSANPDVILIAGGVNDYSYAKQASQKPGTWDGTTAPVNGSSFDETYAVMIKNIQTAYPEAVVICLSTWFTMRGTDNGYTLVNGEGFTQSDYDAAIKKVATLMRVPYIDVERCGFSRSNFYPNYSEDSSSIPTHPNARGQRIMGELIADELPQKIAAFLRNVPKT